MDRVDLQTARPRQGLLLPAELAHGFVIVPETVLPCGTLVPGFAVARWLAARGAGGRLLLSESAAPWTNIGYHAARAACAGAGLALLTETQALALAHDVARQAINWSGGAVGAGQLFQGLHLGRYARPQPASVESPASCERRWHGLSNGQRIHDLAGNAFSWVFDDLQGDGCGIVRRSFGPASASVTGAPGAPMQQGLGWWPRVGSNWWGRALARGGSISSQEGAGVFTVIDERPRAERSYIGFRCTLR